MALDTIIFILGLALAALTLMDVFETVIVPGGSRASLRVAKRLVWVFLPIWKLARGRRRGLTGAFAPLILVFCFMIWMAFLAFGFGLMAYSARSDFKPPLHSLMDAIYIVGSSLVTVGLSESNPGGAARWIVLAAGFCGLAVMTMAVTYLLEVQTSVSKRDIGIIKLNTSAGEPPSAMTLFQRFAAIDNQAELGELLREGRNWCATVRQSHSNHPSLIYFQSVGAGSGWPAALGAFLDIALISGCLIDDPALRGPAMLLRDEASRMARELAAVTRVAPLAIKRDEPQLAQAAKLLSTSHYPLRGDVDFGVMAQQRSDYLSLVDALAAHLGKPTTVLVRQT